MLRDVQAAFANALTGDSAVLATMVKAGSLTASQKIGVYQHNVVDTLTVALSSIYPVIEKLVSPGFFGFAASEYLRHHMPRSAALQEFGAAFPGFLKTFLPVQSLPYLPDVARLEWAWHRAFHASEVIPSDRKQLSGISDNDWPQLRFTLNPSAQIIASPYPIIRIFEVNQDDYVGDLAVGLDEPGVTALVIRRGLVVRVEPLEPGEAELLVAMQRNTTLADALDWAIRAQPDFELEPVLSKHFDRGTFSTIGRS